MNRYKKAAAMIVAATGIWAATACGEDYVKYQKVIAGSFPGYQILQKTDFAEDIQRSQPSPGLVTGRFNYDDHRDFAAIIRHSVKKRFQSDKHSYDYYDGKKVVCYGSENGEYSCREVTGGQFPVVLPFDWYLYVIPSGHRIGCFNDKGEKDYTTVEVDVLGSEYPEKASSVLLYKRDGSESICVTAD